MTRPIVKTYKEMVALPTFEERIEYLKLSAAIGNETFGFDRVFNQRFYKSKEWKDIRNFVIIRDSGCDLGCDDRPIFGKILIHHINPISLTDLENSTDFLLNPNYLVCVSHDSHNYIHYGTKAKDDLPLERKPNDMCPWR